MIKAIALDDEPPALEIIETFCKRIDDVDLLQTFTNTATAFSFVKQNHVDLLFLDINMPSVSGIDFFKTMPEKLMVIFTTSYSEYAVESYDLNSVDYLLKPFTFARFQQALQKAQERQRLTHTVNADPKEYINLKSDYGIVRIDIGEIQFIEGLDNYLKIHLHNQQPVVVRLTMKAMQELLPEKIFIRVHRSYIVNLNRVETLRNKLITIAGEEVPIGRSYEDAALQRLR